MSRPSLCPRVLGCFALPAETLARQVSAFYRTGNSSVPRGTGELHQFHKRSVHPPRGWAPGLSPRIGKGGFPIYHKPMSICTPATWLGPRSVAQDWEGRLSLHHVPWLILTFVILLSLSFSTLLSLITYSSHSY